MFQKYLFRVVSFIGLVILLNSCRSEPKAPPTITVSKHLFGELPDGREIHKYILQDSRGPKAVILNYGARLLALEMPDNKGNLADLIIGPKTPEDLLAKHTYAGATLGRYTGRLQGGSFTLDGNIYRLETNQKANGNSSHLHGGLEGFDQKLWEAKLLSDGVTLSYTSPDGEEGYPGNLNIEVTFRLNLEHELHWEATATTDKACPVSLSLNAQWNLTGDPQKQILDHALTVPAKYFVAVGTDLIADGYWAKLKDTLYDYNTAQNLGERLGYNHLQYTLLGGISNAFVITEYGEIDEKLNLGAKLYEPNTGRLLKILTNQPTIYIDTDTRSRKELGIMHKSDDPPNQPIRQYIILRPQLFPNAPNAEEYPDPTLRPNKTFQAKSIYKFETKDGL